MQSVLMQSGPAGYLSLSGIKTGVKCYNSIRVLIIASLMFTFLVFGGVQVGMRFAPPPSCPPDAILLDGLLHMCVLSCFLSAAPINEGPCLVSHVFGPRADLFRGRLQGQHPFHD